MCFYRKTILDTIIKHTLSLSVSWGVYVCDIGWQFLYTSYCFVCISIVFRSVCSCRRQINKYIKCNALHFTGIPERERVRNTLYTTFTHVTFAMKNNISSSRRTNIHPLHAAVNVDENVNGYNLSMRCDCHIFLSHVRFSPFSCRRRWVFDFFLFLTLDFSTIRDNGANTLTHTQRKQKEIHKIHTNIRAKVYVKGRERERRERKRAWVEKRMEQMIAGKINKYKNAKVNKSQTIFTHSHRITGEYGGGASLLYSTG